MKAFSQFSSTRTQATERLFVVPEFSAEIPRSNSKSPNIKREPQAQDFLVPFCAHKKKQKVYTTLLMKSHSTGSSKIHKSLFMKHRYN